MTREVVVVAGCRTAQGTFGGTLRDVPAHDLARDTIRETVRRAGVDPAIVDTVIAESPPRASRTGDECAVLEVN